VTKITQENKKIYRKTTDNNIKTTFPSGSTQKIKEGIKKTALRYLRHNKRTIKYTKKVRIRYASRVSNLIIRYAKQNNVHPALLAALIARESGFDRMAESAVGAKGLGQFMPATAESLGIKDPFDSEQSIMGTSKYIKEWLDKFASKECPVCFSLAGYKEGPYRVKRNKGYNQSSHNYISDINRLYNEIVSKQIITN